MKTFEKIELWGNHHNPKWLVIFRIILGLILIWKGVAFILNLDVLAAFLRETGISDKISASVSISVIADLIIALHLIGGFCIAFGLRTRLFCVLNLPVLIGAVFFLYLKDNILKPYAELWLSIPVLLLLICFIIEGNGRVAVEQETDPAVESGVGRE
jgi:putative oxidoreductase